MNQNRRKNRGGPQTASYESRSTRQRAVVAEGVYNNPHFMYAATSQIGNIMRIQVASGTVWEGIFRTFSAQFEIVLEMACKVDNPDSHNSSLSAESHVDKLIFKPCDIVTMCAREVDLDYATRDTFQTDAAISSRLNGGQGRGEEKELEPWEGPCANGQLGDGGLDLLEPGSNGWDANEMFRKNEQKYGVQSTYDHSLSGYTVPLQHSDSQDYREAEAKANEIAAEIESQPSYKSRLELENGDEEERFAAVSRPNAGGAGGNNGGRMGGGGHHHQHTHDYKESTPSDKYVPPNKRKGSQSSGKIMRSTPPPSGNQGQSSHQGTPPSQQPTTVNTQANPNNNHNHPKNTGGGGGGGNNIPMQTASYAAHVQHLPQQTPPPQVPQQTPPPQQQQQQQQIPPPQQQAHQNQPPPQQQQQPPPQHMNHARHTPPHAGGHPSHVYNQSMPPRGKQMNGDNMNIGPGGPGGGGGGGMKNMQRPPRNVYGGMNQQYDKMPPQHVQHAQQQEIIRQQQQQQQQQQQPPPPQQHRDDMKDLIKFSKDFKLSNAPPEMVQQQMVNVGVNMQAQQVQVQVQGQPPPQQQMQQQEVKLPMPQQTPPPVSVSPRLQAHQQQQQQQQEHEGEKSSTLSKSKLNPLAKEFVMKPSYARSPSTPTASRPHTPQTPSNQYITAAVNGPPAGQPQMPQLMMPMQAMYVSPQQFQQPVQGSRVRKVMGQVRTDMASQMQVAAATGQPLLAPAPMQQFVYPQGINPQAYQQMHMRMEGYPPIQYIQQPNPSQAPSPAQQQQYAQAGAPGAPGPGQQYQTAVPPPQGPPQMYPLMLPAQPHLMPQGMYHLPQQAPQTMPLLIANPPQPHQHGPNP